MGIRRWLAMRLHALGVCADPSYHPPLRATWIPVTSDTLGDYLMGPPKTDGPTTLWGRPSTLLDLIPDDANGFDGPFAANMRTICEELRRVQREREDVT